MARGKEWRTVSRYPQYEVSNDGEVRHIKRKCVRKQYINKKNGYCYFAVANKETGRPTAVPVHRLVAEAFVETQQGKRCINHKDGNRQNNSVENLEWCTHKENSLHMTYVLRHYNHHPPQSVECVESGIIYPSCSIAGRCTGINRGNIYSAANGKLHTAGGYHWRRIEKGE